MPDHCGIWVHFGVGTSLQGLPARVLRPSRRPAAAWRLPAKDGPLNGVQESFGGDIDIDTDIYTYADIEIDFDVVADIAVSVNCGSL